MKEKVIEIIGESLNELGLSIYSVDYEKEGNNYFLRIGLDGEVLDLNNIVKATHIINPLMDKADIIKENYNLEIFGRSKGE